MNRGRARWPGLTAVCASIVLSAAAQLLMKAGMIELGRLAEVSLADVATSALAVTVPLVCAGLLCYAASMLAWLVALSRFDVSFAYPMLSVSYAIVYAVAVWLPFFAETLSAARVTGIVLILAGVALVSHGGAQTDNHAPAPGHGPATGRD